MTAGTITRISLKFERDFTQIPNAWLRDKRLSRGARGLLAEIMTHDTSEYQITFDTLIASGTEGRDAIRRMVSELEARGYLKRIRRRRNGGRLAGSDWVIQDPHEPVDNSAQEPLPTMADFPTLEKPTLAPPSTVNPTTIRRLNKEERENYPAHVTSDQPVPVDNSQSIRWADDRCPGDYQHGRHELGVHGKCRHCHERPAMRSAS